MSATLAPLGSAGGGRTAADLAAALDLGAARPDGRPHVAAPMIASVGGQATVGGRSAGLGHPADTALLRELRTAVDAILVGPGTLRAERYADLLDDDQRERRSEGGLAPEPLVATISRRGDLPVDIPLFAEAGARIQVYTEAGASISGRGAEVAVERFAAGAATSRAALEHLAGERGVRSVLCEGGPTLFLHYLPVL